MRVAGFILVLCPWLCADVVVLKDGSRVGGRVTEKQTHLEVATDGGLRTYLKEEVDRILKDPKELMGDTDKLIEEAKADYQRIAAMGPTDDPTAPVRAALDKVKRARETTTATRELFPEDKYADLDLKLMQIMQLMRLLRDRLGSEYASRAAGPGPLIHKARPSVALDEAFSILLDPSKRADGPRRAAAAEAFRAERVQHPEIYEVATAAMLFLSRSDKDWRLEGSSLNAVQEYFSQPWIKDPMKMTPASHQTAATWVQTKVESVRKTDAKANVEPLAIFGIGHLGHAPAGVETDKTARLLGLVVQNGILGTAEGHAVRDLNGWIGSGDFDLAVLAFVKEHRAVDTPVVRFVWSYALLRLVHAKKRGWDRPVSAYQTVKVSDPASQEHLNALMKSIKAAAVCNPCAGAGKLRCTNCHGKRELRWDCQKCKGKGKIVEPGYSGFLNAPEIPCYPCRGRGFDKLIKCEKCKEGWNTCRQCSGKEKQPPEIEEICTGEGCANCDGRGFVFKKILWACKSCMGIGMKLSPKADPAKLLP